MPTEKILILGACGQIGSELTSKLRSIYGAQQVVASDISASNIETVQGGLFEIVDANNYETVREIVIKHKIDTVYLLAAMLSASAEKNPVKAWDLNTNSLFHVLNLAKKGLIKKIFWPSSIAVFGPTTPKENTQQHTIAEPTTVYGISKLAGERWCEYYFKNYNVDVRSLRYPGLISWKTPPGGGTTDYAVDIFYEAIKKNTYTSFLKEDTMLPMMYMPDAIHATISLMQAPANNITVRSSYNLAAMSFTPKELATEIQKTLPNFTINYAPDYRQNIANTWPQTINDSFAKKDWGWKPQYNLKQMAQEMLTQLKNKLQSEIV